MKYEEYSEVTKGIEDLALTIGDKVKEKSIPVPTTSIATIKNGEVKETALKCHDSTFYVTPTELVNMDFVSVRSRLLKNAISEIKEHNK